MKLYIWEPNRHGPNSIFVMAESVEDAVKAVEREIATDYADYYEGWGTDAYTLTVVGPGEVITHAND